MSSSFAKPDPWNINEQPRWVCHVLWFVWFCTNRGERTVEDSGRRRVTLARRPWPQNYPKCSIIEVFSRCRTRVTRSSLASSPRDFHHVRESKKENLYIPRVATFLQPFRWIFSVVRAKGWSNYTRPTSHSRERVTTTAVNFLTFSPIRLKNSAGTGENFKTRIVSWDTWIVIRIHPTTPWKRNRNRKEREKQEGGTRWRAAVYRRVARRTRTWIRAPMKQKKKKIHEMFT